MYFKQHEGDLIDSNRREKECWSMVNLLMMKIHLAALRAGWTDSATIDMAHGIDSLYQITKKDSKLSFPSFYKGSSYIESADPN